MQFWIDEKNKPIQNKTKQLLHHLTLKADCKHIQRLSAINASFKKQIKEFMETMTSDDNICLIIIIAMVTVLANIAISNKLV